MVNNFVKDIKVSKFEEYRVISCDALLGHLEKRGIIPYFSVDSEELDDRYLEFQKLTASYMTPDSIFDLGLFILENFSIRNFFFELYPEMDQLLEFICGLIGDLTESFFVFG